MIKVVISNTRRILALILIPVLLIIGINLYVGFNPGVEYSSANVVNIQLTKGSTYVDVSNAFKGIENYSKFEAFDNNSYKAYYQNVSLEELSGMKDDLETKLGAFNTFEVLSYKPTTLVMISDRIFYGIYAAIIIYLAYLAFILKKSGITRDKLIGVLVTDVVLFILQLVIISGLVNLLGLTSYKLSPSIVTFCLGTLLLSALPNIVITQSLSENFRSDVIDGWGESVKRFTSVKLRYIVFIGIGFMLFTAIHLALLPILPVSVLVFTYSLYLYAYGKPVLLEWILNGLNANRFISKNKLLRKEW